MTTPLKVLVAEDELAEVLLLQRAFEKAGVEKPVYFASDGCEVMAYLQGLPPFEDPVRFPLPDMMLLDLGLPGIHGFEIMKRLRAEPRLQALTVVVLSGSEDPEDMKQAYALGAHAYFVKPQSLDELVGVVEGLQKAWRAINAPAPVLAGS